MDLCGRFEVIDSLTRHRAKALMAREEKDLRAWTKLLIFFILQIAFYFYILKLYLFETAYLYDIIVFEASTYLFNLLIDGAKFLKGYYDLITLKSLNEDPQEIVVNSWSLYIDVALHSAKILIQGFCFVRLTFYHNYPFFWTRDIFISIGKSFELIKKVLSSQKILKQLNKLSNIPVPKDKNIDCGICLQNVEIGTMLNCGHFYHKKCLSKWLNQGEGQKKCPVCRAVISFEEKKNATVEEAIQGLQNDPNTNYVRRPQSASASTSSTAFQRLLAHQQKLKYKIEEVTRLTSLSKLTSLESLSSWFPLPKLAHPLNAVLGRDIQNPRVSPSSQNKPTAVWADAVMAVYLEGIKYRDRI